MLSGSSSRPNRFSSSHPFTPLRTPSLRRLRTALSPSRSHRSTSPASTTSESSTATTSPLTRTSSPTSHASYGTRSYRSSFMSGTGAGSSIRHLLMLNRKPSVLDEEMEEERCLFGVEVDVLEPRPSLGGGEMVGIFEVLEGRC